MAGGGSSKSQSDSYQTTTTTTQNMNLQGIEGAATVVSAVGGSTVNVTDGGAIAGAFDYISQATDQGYQFLTAAQNNATETMIRSMEQAGRAGELAMQYVSEASNPGSDSAAQQKILIIAAAAVAGLALMRGRI
jgi:phage-related protein